MCNDRDLPIWLRRKRHCLLSIRGENAGDSELEQTSDVWREPDDQTNNYIGREELLHVQAIGQANDAREINQADDGPEAFEDDEPITEKDRHSRRGRTLRRPQYLKYYAS